MWHLWRLHPGNEHSHANPLPDDLQMVKFHGISISMLVYERVCTNGWLEKKQVVGRLVDQPWAIDIKSTREYSQMTVRTENCKWAWYQNIDRWFIPLFIGFQHVSTSQGHAGFRNHPRYQNKDVQCTIQPVFLWFYGCTIGWILRSWHCPETNPGLTHEGCLLSTRPYRPSQISSVENPVLSLSTAG